MTTDLASPAVVPAVGRRWCLGTRLLVGAALAWLVFVVAQLVLSGHWWAWLLPDNLPPLLFVLVPLLFLLAAPALRVVRVRLPVSGCCWLAASALLAGVLGFGQSGVNLAALTGPPGPPPPGALHVFAWNTQYWDQTDDPDRFYAFLTARHADVYLLQEYLNWDDSKGENGAVRVVDTARLHRDFPGYTVVTRGELLTLSRFPVVATPPVGPDRAIAGRLDVDWQTEFRTAKVLRTDLLVSGRVLSVYNVHIPVHVDPGLNPLSGGFYDYVRHADAQRQAQYQGLVVDIATNPHPTLLAGDFNTTPAMGDLSALRATMRDAADASRSLYPVSWQSGGWLRFWRLDWTFVTRGVRVYRYAFGDAQGMSDHRPQDMTVSVPS